MKKIFIADFLPLANKGEEEIIRGIETLYYDKTMEDVEFRVFGDVEETTKVNNVIVYPRSICYPKERIINGKIRLLNNIWMAIKGFLGLYPYNKNISSYPGLLHDLKTCDKVLIGHDGFFNLKCALLGIFLFNNKIHYAILGAGFNKPGKKISWIYDRVFKKCFDKADYIILREQTAYNYVKQISSNKSIHLLPDPAFFCPSNKYNEDRIKFLISKYNINNSRTKIGITICENSISFLTAFKDSKDKVTKHREFIVDLLRLIYYKTNCIFYFLPHCIEEGAGNDLIIARDIVLRLNGSVESYIITEDMPVLDIKYIISCMDMMIGERTHSIINSITTETPFVVLTCSADFRTHDIIGKGCGLSRYIFNLDEPNLSSIENMIISIAYNLSSIKSELAIVNDNNKLNKEKFLQLI